MKHLPSHKLLKFCVTQSLLQAGFQKSSSSSLNSFTNVIEYLIFNLLYNLKDIPRDTALKYLLKKYVSNNDNVNIDDIFQLLKVCKGSGESVLHVMNIIPKNIDWRGKGGGVKVIKESGEVLESVYDDYVYEFIEEKSDEQRGIEQKNDEMIGKDRGIGQHDEKIVVEKHCMRYAEKSENCIDNNYNNIEKGTEQFFIDENGSCKNDEHKVFSEIKSEQCKIMLYKNGSIICDSRNTLLYDEQDMNSNVQQSDRQQNSTSKDETGNVACESDRMFCLDNLIVAVTNKKGWVNEKDYKNLLSSKKMNQSFLNCYESKFECNLIDEFKFLSCKEICKVQKKSKNEVE